MKQLKRELLWALIEFTLSCSIIIPAVLLMQTLFVGNESPSKAQPESTAQAVVEAVDLNTAEPLPTAVEFVGASAEATEATTETTEATEPPTAATTEGQALYDVPLNEDLQIFIIDLCEEKHIDPALVFAVIAVESNFNASTCGDSGNSHGLMQIQPRWNQDVMSRTGCYDLFDPYQNVTVGIEILAAKLDTYGGDIGKALTAYNAGDGGAWNYYFSQGIYASGYAVAVMSYAENLS